MEENGKSDTLDSRPLARILRMLYSHWFFGVGWTVAGARMIIRVLGSQIEISVLESASARGKSEHQRATDWLTARRGDPTTSATENRPADGSQAVVKAASGSTGDG
jgi:hypothetical protein